MMDIEFVDDKEKNELDKKVDAENELKTFLVNYVGEKKKPKNDEVTVSLIVEAVAEEFPEFLLAVAEENWIRGYQQALSDVTYSPDKNKVEYKESSEEELKENGFYGEH